MEEVSKAQTDEYAIKDSARFTPILSLITGSLIIFFLGLAYKYTRTTHGEMHELSALLISFAIALALPWAWYKRAAWWNALNVELQAHTQNVAQQEPAKLTIMVALAAGLALFSELMVIRLHASMFQLFAHFKNVSLLSCFLGLGIGYALNQRWRLTTPLFLPLIALQIIFLDLLVRFSDLNFMLLNPASEQATMGLYNASAWPDLAMSYGILLFVFTFNAVCFVPLGQLACRYMSSLEQLKSYSWNLLGSLAGILLITFLSFLWSPPAVWFGFAALATLPFIWKQRASTIVGVTCSIAVIMLLALPQRSFQIDVYSPYQILSLMLDRDNPRLFSNNTWFQSMLDLSDQNVNRRADLKPQADYYGLAYTFKPHPQDVLVVGSGSGNDVAAALRHGAQHVDAVEIDPGIIQMGAHMHPENPYGDLRVSIINDDARAYIKHTTHHYDLIVYGLLDSATSMSGNSAGMRMDSYVWTVEGFKEAKALLKPNGVISMAVCMYPQMGPKVSAMLRQVFPGINPYIYKTNWDAGFTFVIGENLKPPSQAPPFDDMTKQYANTTSGVDVSTDDWPFLFMFERKYPFSYAAVIGALLILSLVMVFRLVPETRSSFSWSCFFLGAGFMLIETKSITELALVYGSTWFVTSVVIAAILLLAYLANLVVSRIGCPHPAVIYSLLYLSIIFGLLFSLFHPSFADATSDRLIMTLVLTMPVFFSGFAFSSELKGAVSVSSALSSNLLGAMLGGFLEYNSMYFGYRSLYWLALVMYIAAFVLTARRSTRATAEIELSLK